MRLEVPRIKGESAEEKGDERMRDEATIELTSIEMIMNPNEDYQIYGIQATLLKLMKPQGW